MWKPKKSLTREDIERFNNIPMLVDGLIAKKQLSILYAESGKGKTLAVLSITKKILDKNKNMHMVFFDYDGGKARSSDMFGNILDTYPDRVSFVSESSTKVMKSVFEDMMERGGDLSNYIIIIDALQNFVTSNGKSITNNDEITEVMDILKSIRDKQNATILVVHHSNKADKEGYATFRGAQAIMDGCDTLLKMEPAKRGKFENKDLAPDTIKLNVKIEKPGFKITHVAHRLEFDRSKLEMLNDIGVNEIDEQQEIEKEEARHELQDLLEVVEKNNGISKIELYEALGTNRVTGAKRIKKAVENGLVEIIKKGNKDLVYTKGYHDVK
jgi:hypothetical protein